MKQKTKQKISLAFNNLVFLMAIAMMFLGVSMFYIGLHNADLAFNILSISDQLKTKDINIGNAFEIYDKGLGGEQMSVLILFKQGLMQMRNAFALIFISAIFLGYYINDFKTKQKEEKWNKKKK